jgi:hypothetical protein
VSDRIADIRGRTALVLAADGPPITAGADVPDIIGRTWGTGAEFVVIPAERLADDFFTLASGLAGEVLQKFVNYRLRVVVVGDIARHTAASSALRSFVGESNRGRHVLFVDSVDELGARLAG